MKSTQLLIERKRRNPLRQLHNKKIGEMDYNSPDFWNYYINYYKAYPPDQMDDDGDRIIKKKYENLRKSSEALADAYLESEVKKILYNFLRPSAKTYKKIYDYQGVQVFLDEENVDDTDYSVGSYNHRMLKHSILVMLVYTRGIIPNRKPRIVITRLDKNPHTKSAYDPHNPPAGIAYNKLIYIDEKYIDEPVFFVHEFAHWVADLIPSQTQQMLMTAFNRFIDIYYNTTKRKQKSPVVDKLTNSMRAKIAKNLGFPEYGLTNHDEFFAVLIENWRTLPNNKLTYKFKSLVKNVLARL